MKDFIDRKWFADAFNKEDVIWTLKQCRQTLYRRRQPVAGTLWEALSPFVGQAASSRLESHMREAVHRILLLQESSTNEPRVVVQTGLDGRSIHIAVDVPELTRDESNPFEE